MYARYGATSPTRVAPRSRAVPARKAMRRKLSLLALPTIATSSASAASMRT